MGAGLSGMEPDPAGHRVFPHRLLLQIRSALAGPELPDDLGAGLAVHRFRAGAGAAQTDGGAHMIVLDHVHKSYRTVAGPAWCMDQRCRRTSPTLFWVQPMRT